MSSRPRDSLDPTFFEAIYAVAEDPWSFATSPYEDAKYAASLAALPQPRYRSAFEIGCSVGVLTSHLAARCDWLLSVDVAERPLDQARRRCQDKPWVHFERMQVPLQFPAAAFDLIVVSEVGYYWSAEDLRLATQLIVDHLRPGGDLLLVHWTPVVDQYPLTGDQVHDYVRSFASSSATLRHLGSGREPTYRLDVYTRAAAASSQP